MLRAYPHVLEQLRVVMRDLAASHRCADVVMRDPYFVTDYAGAVVVDLNGAAVIVGFSYCKYTASRFRRQAFNFC
ncbi:hypothetical protein D3C85_1197900 [compost metagenome]